MVESLTPLLSHSEFEGVQETQAHRWSQKVEQMLEAKLASLQNFSADKISNLKDAAKGTGSLIRRAGSVAVLAGGISLLAACGGEAAPATATALEPQERATIVTPTATELPTQDFQPEATATQPILAPEKTATATPETELQAQVQMSGYLEVDAERPSEESIHLTISEAALAGDQLTIRFFLNSDQQINKLSFPVSEWLGNHDYSVSLSKDITPQYEVYDVKGTIDAFLMTMADKGVTFDNPEVFDAITIRHSLLPEGLGIEISLPNEAVYYRDAKGSYLANPAQRFVENGHFEIQRANTGETTTLTATQVQVSTSDTDSVTLPDFDINPPRIVKIDATGSSSGTTVRVVTATPETQVVTVSPAEQQTTQVTQGEETPEVTQNNNVIVVRSTAEPSAPEAQTNNSSESSWNNEWQPNETVRMSEWWHQMEASGDIHIDSLARQYGGDQISTLESIVSNAHLIPNPQEVTSAFNGLTYIGNCEKMLREVEAAGQGHVTVSQRAYSEIPGGQNCIIVKIEGR